MPLFCWENKSVLEPSQMLVSHVFQQWRKTFPVCSLWLYATVWSSFPSWKTWNQCGECVCMRGERGKVDGRTGHSIILWAALAPGKLMVPSDQRTRKKPHVDKILSKHKTKLGIWSNMGQKAISGENKLQNLIICIGQLWKAKNQQPNPLWTSKK